MSQIDRESVREVTLALPGGGQATITIKAMSVVVVPVPPRPASPGDLYLLHTPTPEASLEISVQLRHA